MPAFFILLFIGCTTPETAVNSPLELKSNQFKGIVQELEMAAKSKTRIVLKDIYFTTNSKNYFIKFSEGYVPKEDLMKYLGKEIIIKGEIKTGQWEDFPPSSVKEQKSLKSPRFGEYIVLDKIYKPQ
jgi:hypothetical protein